MGAGVSPAWVFNPSLHGLSITSGKVSLLLRPFFSFSVWECFLAGEGVGVVVDGRVGGVGRNK